MSCKITNLKITEFMGNNGGEADYSKPMQLCNQSTNSTNKNTSTDKGVLNF